jgi:hypothetical protein
MGRRYSSLAGDGLGDRCVGEGLDTDTDGSGSSTTTTTTATTITTTTDSTSTSSTTTGPDDNVPFGPWWDCAWSARVPIEVTGLEDVSGTFDDAVVLVALGAGRVDVGAFAEDGADLRFVADDHQTELPYELEVWDPQGVSYAWVRAGAVAQGLRFFVYYDGPNTPPAADPSAVWPDAYGGVWHMNGTGDDATINANVAAGDVAFGPGRVGTGLVTYDYDPAAQYTVQGNDTLDNVFTAGATVSAWVRMAGDNLLGEQVVAEKSASSNGTDGWLLELGGVGGSVQFVRGFDSGRRRSEGGAVPLAQWVHLAVLYDDTGGQSAVAQVLVDGVDVGVSAQSIGNISGQPVDDSASPLVLGRGLVGVLDEVRIRRGGTIEDAVVDYRSQSDQLLSYGPEDRSGCFSNPND